MNPAVSVIIVAYKNMDCLRTCLQAIEADKRIEIVVVNNTHQNRGFGAGCNLGATLASAEVLLFLNPDVVTTAEAVLKLAAYARDNRDVGIVGPALTDDSGKITLSVSEQPRRRNFWLVYSFLNQWLAATRWVKPHWYNHLPPKSLADVGVVSGAVMAMRREVFKSVGGFDEAFFLYWEEVDLARRCLDRGLRVVFQPSLVMRHEGGLSTTAAKEQVLVWFRESRAYFMKKHFGLMYAVIVEGWLAVSEHWPLTVGLIGYGLLLNPGGMILAGLVYNEAIVVWGKVKAGMLGGLSGALAFFIPGQFFYLTLVGWIMIDLTRSVRWFRKFYVLGVIVGALCLAW